jgi:hypothetical protein
MPWNKLLTARGRSGPLRKHLATCGLYEIFDIEDLTFFSQAILVTLN